MFLISLKIINNCIKFQLNLELKSMYFESIMFTLNVVFAIDIIKSYFGY